MDSSWPSELQVKDLDTAGPQGGGGDAAIREAFALFEAGEADAAQSPTASSFREAASMALQSVIILTY